MDTFLHIIFVLVCLFLIAVVLLQSGKGGGLGSLGGGGGGSNTVFGGAGAGNFLSRMTAVCAALFMILSAVLAYRSSTGDEAVDKAIDQKIAEQTEPAIDGTGAEPEPPAPSERSTEEPASSAPQSPVEVPTDDVEPEPAPD